jgi:hypothetical protein
VFLSAIGETPTRYDGVYRWHAWTFGAREQRHAIIVSHMHEKYRVDCDGLIAEVIWAENIPHRTIKKGWIVDVAYNGLNVAGIAMDKDSALDLAVILTRGLCEYHGFKEPPCLDNDLPWASN